MSTSAQQVVTERPNLAGSETINTPVNNLLIVGTDNTSTSFAGTIINAGTAANLVSEQGQFVKTGAGTLTIDSATIQGGSAFVIGGGLAVTSSNAAIDYLSLGLGTDPSIPGSTSSGTLNVSGGTLTFNSALQVGDFGGTGTVTQTGGNVVFGTPGVSLNIGNQGGTGTYNLSGGTVTFGTTTTDFVTLGRNSGSNAPSSGTLNLSGGTFNVANGALFLGSNLTSTAGEGTGTINQTGGTLAIGSASRLYLAAAGNGTYNLSGGTLQIGGSSLFGDYNNLGGTYAFNLGGGTIQVVGSALSAGVNATLVGGTTSTIDTNGIGATWSGVLSGSGALAKAGSGALTLTNANTYTGLTTISAGTLALTGSGSINSTSGMVNNGTFDISGLMAGVVPLPNLSGSGTVIDGTNTLIVGTDNTSTSFSGRIVNAGAPGGAGTFVKTGAGTFTIDGATIQGGSAFVIGGGLAVTSSNAAIDYLSLGFGTDPSIPGSTSSGTLNVSGGTLTFNSALQVGDFGGTGTVTQTGGNVVFGTPGVSLNVGNQGGTGTYNLSGGTVTFGTTTTDFVTLGRNTGANPASTGTLNLSGGTFNVANGALFLGSNAAPNTGVTAGTGTINQTGGTLAIGSASRLYLAAAGNGTYNLSGGTLQIGGGSLFGDYNNLGGTYAFNLGGGTIQVVGSALSAGVNATLVGGTTSTIDTNGIGATWSGVLSGSGALAKAGSGALTLTNANTYTGLTTISAGTLALTGSGSINSTSGMVNNGTFDISGVTTTPIPGVPTGVVPLPNLSGSGTVIDGTNILIVGTDGTSTSFSGTIINTGTATDTQQGIFVKTGAGTFTIDGARIQGGSAFVVGGGLAVNSGNTAIDYLSLGLGNALATQVPASTSSGTLNVSGGTLTFNSALQVGDFGGTGTVTQTGGNVVFGVPGTPVSLNIGNQGGTGTYNLSGGTVTFGNSTTDFVTLGRNSGSSAPSSGTLNLSGGTFNVANGALFLGSNLTSTAGEGTGTINQTGGTLAIGSASRLYLAAAGNGTYNLSGGTLQIGGGSLFGDYNNLGGTYAFNLGGGTIQVVGSALSAGVNATLVGGTTSTIDTNGIGATWSGVLSGSGALAKVGNGVLTLTGANTYGGGTALDVGTISLGSATALGTGTLAMAANTTLDFGNSYTLNNTVTLSGDPTINVNAGLTGTLAGAISDGTAPGDLVKTGAGNLVLSAANNYTGATAISAGTLALVGAGSIAQSSGVTDNGTFDVSGANADVSIRSLSGSGTVALGARTLTLTAANGDFGGGIAGSGGLTLAAGIQRLSGTSTYTGSTNVQGGDLQVDGALVNSLVTVGSGATLSGTGSVAGATINGGGTISPGSSIGTLTVNGPYSQLAGSTYAVQLGDGVSVSDRIVVNGHATLANGAILDVSGPTSGLVLPTARYTVLTAADGVSGTYTLTGNTAISTFYRLMGSYDANDVYLIAQQFRSFADAALTPNQLATAGALDSLPTGSALRAAIGELPTDAAARGAFDQLSGEIHASAKTVLLEQSSAPRDAATDRLRDAYCGVGASSVAMHTSSVSPPAGDNTCNPHDTVVWTRGFGSWGSISGDGNAARVSQSMGGVFFGADTPVFSDWRAGVFGGYDHSTFNVDDRMSSASSDDYHLGVYGGSQWGPLGLRLGASYTWHSINTSRSVAFEGYADHLDANYNAGTAQVFGEVGYRFDIDNVQIEPFANLAYVNLHVDGFGEQGNSAALTGNGATINMAYSTFGARASTTFGLGNLTLVASGSVGWLHAYGNSTSTSVLALRGSMPYSVAGVPVTRDSAVITAGVGTALTRNLSAHVSYTGQFGGGFQNQGVFGDLTWRF